MREYECKEAMTGIKFTVGGYGGYTTIKIRQNQDGALVRVERMPERGEAAVPVQITEKKWKKIADTLCDRFSIFDWQKHYQCDWEVMDGTEWRMEVTLTNRRRRTYDGYEAFPPCWDQLMEFFGEFAEL